MSYNLQVLTHIPSFVRSRGCPWSYSFFLFESAAGVLKPKFHGSKPISLQIFTHFIASGKLRVFARHYIPDSICAIKELYNSLDR